MLISYSPCHGDAHVGNAVKWSLMTTVWVARGASFPNWPTRRQARRRRPGSRTLASPFALRRELLPTSPKYLDDTSAPPLRATRPSLTRSVSSLACSCLAPGLDQESYPTRIAHSPRCLQYDSPETTSPLAAHYAPAARRGHIRLRTLIATILTRRQMLKTRRKKNVKKGIQFCLMVCGASGTGTLHRLRSLPKHVLIADRRPHHIRQHPLRPVGPRAQGVGRP